MGGPADQHDEHQDRAHGRAHSDFDDTKQMRLDMKSDIRERQQCHRNKNCANSGRR
jgi:hypothetical protein